MTSSDQDSTGERNREGVHYHTRHIPAELLNFDNPVGRDVRANGLCDALNDDTLSRLREVGVELVETRLAWWECEPEPGRFDFSRLQCDIERIEKAGMKVGVFPWFQHPPSWYDAGHREHARFRCLEHDEDSSILSLWDERTPEAYERLYAAFARCVGDRLSFLYVGVSGDFGEVCFPSGVKHYRFSPPHGHEGYWCGDRLARISFRTAMEKQHGALDRLNRSWGTRFEDWQEDLMPSMPFGDNSLERRRDFARWYTESLLAFTDRVCRIARKCFPQVNAALPIGFPYEPLRVGQIKSLATKTAACHGMGVRWTGAGFLKSFAKTNLMARRVASAAHFYGASFGTEAALIIEKENAANALYEGLANGASIVHDDPRNIQRAFDIHRQLRPRMVVDPPQSPLAVFYPLEGEMLETAATDIELFIDRGVSLRASADFDICDSVMIRDGFLEGKQDLLFLTGTPIPRDVADTIVQFAQGAGRVWLFGDTGVSVLEETGTLESLAEDAGSQMFTDGAPREPGVYRCDRWPEFEPYASLRVQSDGDEVRYVTVHGRHVSTYWPGREEFDVAPKTAVPQGPDSGPPVGR